MVRSLAARRFAERVHAGEPDRYGAPLLDHVRRVAAAVPPDARTVAWLHEVLECTTVPASELAGIGVTADELRAVELLTHAPSADTTAYLMHIALIAAAPGRAGELARTVKVADLRDRVEHQHTGTSPTVVRPPYHRALTVLSSTASPTGRQTPRRSVVSEPPTATLA